MSLRSLFAVTAAFAVIYACLNRFGALAHAAVWIGLLVAGTLAGVTVGTRLLGERDRVVGSVQAGALGAAAGFAAAFALLLPANTGLGAQTLLLLGVLGLQAAFTLGGAFGVLCGILRVVTLRFAKTRTLQAHDSESDR